MSKNKRVRKTYKDIFGNVYGEWYGKPKEKKIKVLRDDTGVYKPKPLEWKDGN